MADLNRVGDQEVKIVGTDGLTPVEVIGGRLSTSSAPPATPAAATAVNQVESGNVSGTDDLVYTITSGKTLRVVFFSAGSESNADGSKCVLYYDPNGNGSGMSIIETLYNNGTTYQVSLDESYVGNGTRAIRMRRENIGGGSLDITAKWIGYEE